jgi:hypothetical protein
VAPRQALKLIQKLHGHEKTLQAAAKSGAPDAASATMKDIHPSKQERAS